MVLKELTTGTIFNFENTPTYPKIKINGGYVDMRDDIKGNNTDNIEKILGDNASFIFYTRLESGAGGMVIRRIGLEEQISVTREFTKSTQKRLEEMLTDNN